MLEKCPSTPCLPKRVLGSDITLDVFLKDKLTKMPIDISAATELEAIFLNADGTFLEEKLTTSGIAIIDGPGGHMQVLIDAADSALLKPSNINVIPLPQGPSYSDIEFHYTIGGKTTIVNAPQSINLVPRLFPTAP